MPADAACPQAAIANPPATHLFDAKLFARAFRALRTAMGSKRASSGQVVWFDGTSAVTAGNGAAGRFVSKASIVPQPLGVERQYLDKLATAFANRFHGTPMCTVSGDRLIVRDSVLTCSCPVLPDQAGRPEYPYDERVNARGYHVNRIRLLLEAGFLRGVRYDFVTELVDLTPLHDVQAALEDESLETILGRSGELFADIRDSRLLLSTRSGPNTGIAFIDIRPIGEPMASNAVTQRVNLTPLIATCAFHSDPYVEFHFLEKWLTIVSASGDETCTFLLPYIRTM